MDYIFLNIKHRKVHTIQYRYFTIENINFEHLNNSDYAPLCVINTAGDIRRSIRQINGGMNLVKKRFPFPTKYEIISDNPSNNINSNNKKNVTINKEINKTIETVNINNGKKSENENQTNSLIFYFKIYFEYILIIGIIGILLYLNYTKNKEIIKYKKIVDTEKNDIIKTKIAIV